MEKIFIAGQEGMVGQAIYSLVKKKKKFHVIDKILISHLKKMFIIGLKKTSRIL